MQNRAQLPEPDIRLAAACGLYCPACRIYQAQRETPENRARIIQEAGWSAEALRCDGCRSESRFFYCETCKMIACSAEKGLDFCGECDQYPCPELQKFQAARPHRLELWTAQARIREVGWQQWFAEMGEHYACPACGTLNSAYDPACRACGATPSCGYVAAHQAEIEAYRAQRD
jgi:predicted RNA-binding Zn-ribbon protein involved in translation (DUF1610 family)